MAGSMRAGRVVKVKIIAGTPVADGVFLNGQGPYRFLLDTGSEANLLDVVLAGKLGIEPEFQARLITAAGTTAVNAGSVERVLLGPAEASHQDFLITSLDGLHALSPDIRGILGQPFLLNFDYMLDFEHHTLTFGAAPDEGSPIPFQFIHNRMAVPTSEGDLVLDSGTGTLFLFRAAPFKGTATAIRTSSGLFSSVVVNRVHDLRIGGKIYHPRRVAFDAGETSLGVGLLPASLFRAVTISNSRRYIALDPRSGR